MDLNHLEVLSEGTGHLNNKTRPSSYGNMCLVLHI